MSFKLVSMINSIKLARYYTVETSLKQGKNGKMAEITELFSSLNIPHDGSRNCNFFHFKLTFYDSVNALTISNE